jgi:hypothetical protein
MPMAWRQDFSPNKPRTVIFTSGDDTEAKQLVIEWVNSTGLVAIDLGSLAIGGAMHEVALLYPASISTSSAGFVDSARTPTDNSLQAPKVEGEITSSVATITFDKPTSRYQCHSQIIGEWQWRNSSAALKR